MKNKRTETDGKKKIKEKKNKNVKVKIDENEKINTYEQYRIEKLDLISQSSGEDIETKMNKLIQLKKKGINLEEYNKSEIEKIKFTKQPLNDQIFTNKEKENNEQQIKQDKLMKIKSGLNSFMNYFSSRNCRAHYFF